MPPIFEPGDRVQTDMFQDYIDKHLPALEKLKNALVEVVIPEMETMDSLEA